MATPFYYPELPPAIRRGRRRFRRHSRKRGIDQFADRPHMIGDAE